MESGVTQPGTFTHSSSVSMIVCQPNASAHQAACFRTSSQSITTVYHRSTMKSSLVAREDTIPRAADRNAGARHWAGGSEPGPAPGG